MAADRIHRLKVNQVMKQILTSPGHQSINVRLPCEANDGQTEQATAHRAGQADTYTALGQLPQGDWQINLSFCCTVEKKETEMRSRLPHQGRLPCMLHSDLRKITSTNVC